MGRELRNAGNLKPSGSRACETPVTKQRVLPTPRKPEVDSPGELKPTGSLVCCASRGALASHSEGGTESQGGVLQTRSKNASQSGSVPWAAASGMRAMRSELDPGGGGARGPAEVAGPWAELSVIAVCGFLPGQGLVLYPLKGDKLDIICPKVDSKTVGQYEYYKVYMVDKDQADRCIIKKTKKTLLNCSRPHQDVKFTIKFQEFSPNIRGLEFQKNKDYYIICLSTEGNSAGYSRNNPGSKVALFTGIISGCIIFIAIIITLVVLLLKYHRRHRKHSPQHTTTPKRGGNNSGWEPSDVIIPLKIADSVSRPHYEKVSGDYGHPVCRRCPQSPANINYKV